MIKSSSPSSGNKAPPGLIGHLAALWRALGDRFFASSDQAARRHGWEIHRRRGGLARRYRDPRFDWLSSCPWCHGSGSHGHHECQACQGSGRVCRPRPSASPGGEPDDDEPAAQAQ